MTISGEQYTPMPEPEIIDPFAGVPVDKHIQVISEAYSNLLKLEERTPKANKAISGALMYGPVSGALLDPITLAEINGVDPAAYINSCCGIMER